MFHQSGPRSPSISTSSGKNTHTHTKKPGKYQKTNSAKGTLMSFFCLGDVVTSLFHTSVLYQWLRWIRKDLEIQGVNLYLMSWCCQTENSWPKAAQLSLQVQHVRTNEFQNDISHQISRLIIWSYHFSFSSDFVQPETVWFLNETRGELHLCCWGGDAPKRAIQV